MPGEFDPLYHWLRIPPSEQPPLHYRLLGLVLFEINADVISTPADRQMSHVRNFQGGKHEGDAAEVLNQLAGAQICLLNAQRRQAYDDQLRKTLATTSAATSGAVVGANRPPLPPPA